MASIPTTWRVLDRIDAVHLGAARAAARARARAGCAGPDLGTEPMLDVDATITLAHSDKQDATLDRPEVACGEALAGLLRPGNAGSNTAADHITVLDLAPASLPAPARPPPGRSPTARPASSRSLFALVGVSRVAGLLVSYHPSVPVGPAVALTAVAAFPDVSCDQPPSDGAVVVGSVLGCPSIGSPRAPSAEQP